MMQTDVLTSHLNANGYCYVGRTRLRGMIAVGTATAGTINIWDTTVDPITGGTYIRSGYTITVTLAAHGLTTGQQIGITFGAGTGGTATNGNYIVTVTNSSTFTITDINTGTITGTGGCTFVVAQKYGNSPWVASFDTAAVTAGANVLQLTFPGEGILCHVGLYCQLANMTGVTVFYG
jgi:hypothetical protein